MIDKFKLNKIVEYIKSSGFEFETAEVLEDLDSVLAYYKLIDTPLTDGEYLQLMFELLPLAEQFEFQEVEYLVNEERSLMA